MKSTLFFLMVLSVLSVLAQKTTRNKLKLKEDVSFETKVDITDTIKPLKGDIGLFGYEKAQNSAAESFFVTNNTLRQIIALSFTISYLNSRGEKLHSRTETVKCSIPPSETRKIDIKSWDNQRLWYYLGSHSRHNDFGNPFDIRIHIEYFVSPI